MYRATIVALSAATLLAGASSAALAQEVTTIRMQTHYTQEAVSGKLAQSFIDDVELMSNGLIDIEMFWASSGIEVVGHRDVRLGGDGRAHPAPDEE